LDKNTACNAGYTMQLFHPSNSAYSFTSPEKRELLNFSRKYLENSRSVNT
jgi:hypothetical protein